MENSLFSVKAKEITLDVQGYHFLCIIGTHINGGFLAIPNWNICCELGDANDFAYNTNKIYIAIKHIKDFNGYYFTIADTLAYEIRKEGY